MGNKGAVCIRMRLHDSTFCFVSSHLAAHRGNVEGRNNDFASIMAKSAFSGEGESLTEGDSGGRPKRQLTVSRPLGLLDHEFIIWLGDLNYRVDARVPVETVMGLCKDAKRNQGALQSLLRDDQLRKERTEGRVFDGFEEANIQFLPTYKFIPGTSRYDDRPDKKMRAPAWCDRILWRVTRDPRHLQPLYYGSCEQLVASDHKPVMGLFDVAVRTTVAAKRQEVYQNILRKLDEMEKRARPCVSLEPSDGILDLGHVPVGVAVEGKFVLRNTGEVAAPFRFVPKPEERHVFQPWLEIEPSYGMLAPGESVSLRVTAGIGPAVARDLALGRPSLSDILILRIEMGRDYFLTIAGRALPSCFGCSPSQLSGRIEPLRALAPPESNDLDLLSSSNGSIMPGQTTPSSKSATTTSGPMPAGKAGDLMRLPKEVWRLVDAIVVPSGGIGLKCAGLLVSPGIPSEVLQIRECLDAGTRFPSGLGALAFGQVLLELLSSMVEPVIPCALFPGEGFDGIPLERWCQELASVLPSTHYNLLVYLIAFCRELLLPENSKQNMLNPDALAFIMSRCCMRGKPHDNALAHSPPVGEGIVIRPGSSVRARIAVRSPPLGKSDSNLGDPGLPSLPGASAVGVPDSDEADFLGVASSATVDADPAKSNAGSKSSSGSAATHAPKPSVKVQGSPAFVSFLSDEFSDLGTRWRPSQAEQKRMLSVFHLWLTSDSLDGCL